MHTLSSQNVGSRPCPSRNEDAQSSNAAVCLACILSGSLLGVIGLEFSDVPIVVGLHLMVGNLRLIGRCLLQQIAVEQLQDLASDSIEFILELGAVLAGKTGLIIVSLGLFLLLNAVLGHPARILPICDSATDECRVRGQRGSHSHPLRASSRIGYLTNTVVVHERYEPAP